MLQNTKSQAAAETLYFKVCYILNGWRIFLYLKGTILNYLRCYSWDFAIYVDM